MIDSGTFLLNTDTGQVWHSQLELYQLLDRYEEVLVDICSKDPESIREEMIQQIQKTPSERLLEIRKQLRI